MLADHGVRIAVIIPVFGHSGLVWDALRSLIDQDTDEPFGVVLVNDGCRSAETDLVGHSLSANAPRSIIDFRYLAQNNRGLSGARNSGIEVALSEWPSLDAIFFLDADNRLSPHSIRRMRAALDAKPDADWFYPDFDFFGMRRHSALFARYSVALHALQNNCEAGSLVRARILRSGLRFDETLKQGFEDWDFWLSAIELGFRGTHEPGIGLRYRKRPESMLANSTRDRAGIMSRLEAKHPWIRDHDTMGRLQASEFPRFLIVTPEAKWAFCTDPLHVGELSSLSDLDAPVWRWLLLPHENFVPPTIVFASVEQITSRVGPWILWDIERRLDHAPLACFDENAEETRYSISISDEELGSSAVLKKSFAIGMKAKLFREILLDNSTDWFDSIVSGLADVKVSRRGFRQAHNKPVKGPVGLGIATMALVMKFLRSSQYRAGNTLSWRLGVPAQAEQHTLPVAIDHALKASHSFPVRRPEQKHVGFICPIVDFGGVEKVAFQVAAELKRNGFTPHLIAIGTPTVYLASDVEDLFATVSWLLEPGLHDWSGNDFLGTRLSKWGEQNDPSHVIGMLSWLDVAINCHSSDINGFMGDLRRAGVICLNYQHIVERSEFGRSVGHPFLGLAYEHAYEKTICCSSYLKRWFLAQGVPASKLISVPNGPGFEIDMFELSRVSQVRSVRRAEGRRRPLNVIYIGRFDRQKALDRLVAVVTATAGDRAGFQWRCIGKSILNDPKADGALRSMLDVEPPIYEAEQLIDALSWADVLIIPSRYEGLPLTAIEAMKLGCVVISSSTGAIDELIVSGRDGFVLPQDDFVNKAIESLSALRDDRDLLHRLSLAAQQRAKASEWSASCAELVDFLKRKTGMVGDSSVGLQILAQPAEGLKAKVPSAAT